MGHGRDATRGRATIATRYASAVARSIWFVLLGTFTLRFSTGLTGALLAYYLADLPAFGGPRVDPIVVGVFSAAFYVAELVLSPFFGSLSDQWGHHRVMQLGPLFGIVAVVLTWLTTNLLLLGGTRFLEGASTAASVPSILGFLAMATAGDELLRGRASARFEGATLAGLGAGFVVAGVLYQGAGPIPALGRDAFLLNAGIYALSFAIYRWGVTAPDRPTDRRRIGIARYLEILRSSHVWLLAPTWIAINAALGVWTSQSIFQLVNEARPRFRDQWLMGGFDPVQVSLGFAVALVVFFAGLWFWGDRFKRYRRTTIIAYGIGGGTVLVVAGLALNHLGDGPAPARLLAAVVAGAGLFVLAGATPAALGLLADLSEAFPHDRGAIMGLYSVFLALGQIGGSLLGGVAADVQGIDGMLILTLMLLAIALVPLGRLRSYEAVVEAKAEEARAVPT
jgi:MFS family permease